MTFAGDLSSAGHVDEACQAVNPCWHRHRVVFCIGSAVPLLAKNSADPFGRPVKSVAPQLCLRCLGGRHSYVYAVLAGSNSVPVSSIFSQRTYAAGWSAVGLLLSAKFC